MKETTRRRNGGKRRAEPAPLGALGRFVTGLMVSRGIRYQRELAEILWEKAGYRVSQQALSKWFTDQVQPDGDFPRALREALELTQEEAGRLAWAFALREAPPS